jgi:alpha-galactosidase/6-phospho-beta-glucosidase family protein
MTDSVYIYVGFGFLLSQGSYYLAKLYNTYMENETRRIEAFNQKLEDLDNALEECTNQIREELKQNVQQHRKDSEERFELYTRQLFKFYILFNTTSPYKTLDASYGPDKDSEQREERDYQAFKVELNKLKKVEEPKTEEKSSEELVKEDMTEQDPNDAIDWKWMKTERELWESAPSNDDPNAPHIRSARKYDLEEKQPDNPNLDNDKAVQLGRSLMNNGCLPVFKNSN